MGVVISSNTKGNKLHSAEDGKFVSKEDSSSSKENTENKLLEKMGLNPKKERKVFVKKGEIQKNVPQTNMDGSPRFFINKVKPEEKMNYIKKMRELDKIANIKSVSDNDLDTMDIDTLERKIFREESIENEIEKQNKQGEKKFERKATVIFGLPASGKTTLAQYLKAQDGSFEIDSDFFTEIIPEFKESSSNIGLVHREAGYMSKEMMKKLASEGANMTIGKVGGGMDTEYLKTFFDELENNGYEVELVLNDISLEEGLKRNIERFKRGNPRLVPAIVSIIADATVFDNFGYFLNHPTVKNGAIYSNEVPKGTAPKLIKKFKKEL